MTTSQAKRRTAARKTTAATPAAIDPIEAPPAPAPAAKTAAKTAARKRAPAKQAAPVQPPVEAAPPPAAKKPAARKKAVAVEAPAAEPAAPAAAKKAAKTSAKTSAKTAPKTVAKTALKASAEKAAEPAAKPAAARTRKSAAVAQPAEAPVELPAAAANEPSVVATRSTRATKTTKKTGTPRGRQAVPPPAEPPAPPPRYSLGAREDEHSVFGDHELLDREQATAHHLRLLGPLAWRCDCATHAREADCEHGEALLSLLPLAQVAELDAGWPAREAEVWLVQQGEQRYLQWVPGLAVPAALQALAAAALDEQLRLPAEQAHAWLQALLDAARVAGVPLRVAPEVWPQLAWARDAQARVARLEPLLAQAEGLAGLLRVPLPAYQWEAALFAVCAGRALLADDLGLGQRGAAIAAIRLWSRLFGVEPALVIAPAATHEAWRRDIQRLLGEWPAQLTLAERAPGGPRPRPALLVVDALDGLDEAALQALRALEVPQLLLIAEREPLGDARLPDWIDWLDSARRGPLARLRALPADASKKAQREALQSVLLSRRRRELAQLPPALLEPRWLTPDGPSQPPAALQQLRALLQRWQQLRFLGAAEQQQLLQALALLPPSSRHVLAAKAEAVLGLLHEWLPAAAARLLVCAQSDTLLDSLAQALKLRKLAVLRLRAGAEGRQALQDWRAEGQAVLLASDAALAAQADAAGLDEPRLALVHADLPWSGALLARRLQLACGDEPRGVPVAQLLVEGSLDRALLNAQQAGVEFPAWLDAPPAWLDEAQLAALMPALQALLDAAEAA